MTLPINYNIHPGSNPYLIVNGKLLGRRNEQTEFVKTITPNKVLAIHTETNKKILKSYGLKTDDEVIVIEMKKD